MLDFIFWLVWSSFYDVLVRSFPVGKRLDRACLYFLIGSIFVLWRSRNIVTCWHTWRLCLPLFSDWVDLRSMTFLSDCYLLSHVTGVYALLQRFGWDYQSRYFIVPVRYLCTVSTRSFRWWSLCLTYTRNRACVFFLLNFGLASLLFLVNYGSDKPNKYLRSIYAVGRTWKKLKSV